MVNGVEAACDDPKYAISLKETYFCAPPDTDHPANTKCIISLMVILKKFTAEMYCSYQKGQISDFKQIRQPEIERAEL